MRLTTYQRETIHETIKKHFGDDAKVYLFGSRVDDSKKGGDIDLYVECPEGTEDQLKKSLKANADIQMKIGEQKIDIVVWSPGDEIRPIHESARREGIIL